MLEKYNGIIFKAIPYSETSLVLDIYTQEIGLHSFIVSGVRKKNSKLGLLYRPMNLINFVAYNSAKSKLYRIKEAGYNHMYQNIIKDVKRSTMGMFMIDLCRNSIKETENNTPLYTFIYDSFKILDETKDLSHIYHLWFSLELTKYIGFYPNLSSVSKDDIFDLAQSCFVYKNAIGKYTLHPALTADWKTLLTSTISDQNINLNHKSELLDAIIKYYQLHVHGFKELKSLEVCKMIFR